MQDKDRSFVVILILIVVVALWMISPYAVYQLVHAQEDKVWTDALSRMGVTGDTFGAINALFSGLAFAGVIWALLLQTQELSAQRQSDAETQRRLYEASKLQAATVDAMREITHAHSYKTAVELLQSEKVRAARRHVFTELAHRPFAGWSEHDYSQAELVCATYDTVGIMTKRGALPIEYISDNWGPSLRNSWPHLASLVAKRRTDWADDEYWDDYVRLVACAFDLKQQDKPTSLVELFKTSIG